MRVYIDTTAAEQIVLGYRRSRSRSRRGSHRAVLELVPRQTHNTGMLLSALAAFLRRHRIKPRSGTELVVVAGPGRFSSLREAVTIANLLHWGAGLRLSTVKRSAIPPENSREYLHDLDRRRKAATLARPWYGMPPSITRPRVRGR